MATIVQPKLVTAEEFMEMELGEGAFELVRGEVIKLPPPMPLHGLVCANVAFTLSAYGRRTRLGYVLANDTALQTEQDPDTVRGADISFYSESRWPRSQVGSRIPPVPPDVAVEVLSPRNRPADISQKVVEYVQVGVLLVLVVDPQTRTVVIHRPGQQSATTLQEPDMLKDLPELPGFECAVAEFFV